MMKLLIVIATCILSITPFAFAGEQHDHGAMEHVGTVEFATSCAADVQKTFNHAVALLHSFAYPEAEQAFESIATADPNCSMAFWGVAMSNLHPVWAAANPVAAPTPDEFKRGAEASAKAKSIGNPTKRELDYINAIAAYFQDSAGLDHPARAMKFSEGMERVYKNHPEDLESGIFYALALLGTANPKDKTYVVQKKAAEILNAAVQKLPQHPGIAHYVIHSYDYPALAELALPAARLYSKVAADSPHALHMPSHIFIRLGLWDESIDSNLASAKAAKKRVGTNDPSSGSYDQLHALDYLMYAYLQRGQDAKARSVLNEIAALRKLDKGAFQAAFALAASPARFAVERRQWKEAAAIKDGPDYISWDKFQGARAIYSYARAVGSARSGDPENAKEELARLQSFRDSLLQAKDQYWADQVEIHRLSAAAWIARAKKQNDEALRLLRSAADLEDATDKHPVTPGAIWPAREQLGELFLELNQPSEALQAFEATLSTSPGRFQALRGAATAAKASGDDKKAAKYQDALVKLCGAGCDRPEVQVTQRK